MSSTQSLPSRPANSLVLNGRIASTSLVLGAIVLLAAVLRLHDAGAEGFWKNELFSVVWSRQPVSFLISEGLRVETNPPLYYVMLKAWTLLAGESEFAARLPSVIAATLAVPLTYLLGRELLGVRAGLWGAGLLAVTPLQIYFAHEVRAYALLPAFALLAMLGVARMLAAAQEGRTLPVSGMALYAGGCTGLVHTHAIGMFAVATLFMLTLTTLRTAPRATVLRFLGATAVVAALSLPIATSMAVQSHSANIGWMPAFGYDTLLILNRYLLIGPLVRGDLGIEGSRAELMGEMVLASFTALTLIWLGGRRLTDQRARLLLLEVPVAFILLLSAVSIMRPVLIPRVALWLSPLICLVVAALIAERPVRRLAGAAFALCVALGLWNNVAVPAQHKPDWRALIAAYPPGVADGPVLVAGPHAGPLGIGFHAAGAIKAELRHWVPDPARPATTADQLERRVSGAQPIETADIARRIAGGRPVVLFLDDDDEILIGQALAAETWFAGARRQVLPGLTVFAWN